MDVLCYVDAHGHDLFTEDLSEWPQRARIRVRNAIERMELGNLGDHKSVGSGVWEHRIHAEGGIRVYFGMQGRSLILLLTTGLKRSQARDIEIAKARWADHEEE
jgi:putative addiction module killer protein